MQSNKKKMFITHDVRDKHFKVNCRSYEATTFFVIVKHLRCYFRSGLRYEWAGTSSLSDASPAMNGPRARRRQEGEEAIMILMV